MAYANMEELPRCPKCGAPMAYLVEKEKNGSGIIKITRYYRCPACGTKVIDEQLLIEPSNGVLKIIRLDIKRKIIYSNNTARRRRHSDRSHTRNTRRG
ncbi:MAG: hypothetical protein F7C34_04120 [Desulfurococcales archaeon]|nr:hypothetical protein [Desulfurococcales archaeon]